MVHRRIKIVSAKGIIIKTISSDSNFCMRKVFVLPVVKVSGVIENFQQNFFIMFAIKVLAHGQFSPHLKSYYFFCKILKTLIKSSLFEQQNKVLKSSRTQINKNGRIHSNELSALNQKEKKR